MPKEEESEVPEDLGLKMGTPEEAQWTKIKNNQEETIRASKINITVAEAVLGISKLEIAKEKEKFKRMSK